MDSGSTESGILDGLIPIFPYLIPIVAIVMGIGLAMLGVWTDFNKKRSLYEFMHKERMAAIEKGIDVPPLPPELLRDPRRERSAMEYLRRGLVWSLVGVTLTFALYEDGVHGAYYGLIAVAIGVANLIMFAVASRAQSPGRPGP